jgi:hypothetical protein
MVWAWLIGSAFAVDGAAWQVEVEAAGKRPRSWRWEAATDQVWSLQIARQTQVTVERPTGPETSTVQDVAINFEAVTDRGRTTLRPVEVVPGVGDVQSFVELSGGLGFWTDRPWLVDVARQTVDFDDAEGMDLGAQELARVSLEALVMLWVPLPDTPVGLGGTWVGRLDMGEGSTMVTRCTLVKRRGKRAQLDVVVDFELPEEASVGTSEVSGQLWMSAGHPLPVGATFDVRFELSEGGASATGVEHLSLATRVTR